MKTLKPRYVTFEQAKWLGEKEFDLPTYGYYDGLNLCIGEYKNHSKTKIGDTLMHKRLTGYISAPEQWEVVEWFEQRFNVYIDTRCVNSTRGDNFEFCIHKMNDIIETKNGFNTRQETYSAAFDYIKENNLI